MRLKGLAPIIDYTYLNVLDLNDPDYSMRAPYARNTFKTINIHGGRHTQPSNIFSTLEAGGVEEGCRNNDVGFQQSMDLHGRT